MQKQRRTRVLLAGAGLCALLAGVGLPVASRLLDKWHEPEPPQDSALIKASPVQEISAQKSLSPTQRTAKLEAIAKLDQHSPERDRARYLLASEFIQQGQGKKALAPLKDLENSYSVLAAQILLKRAQAYEQIGDRAKAQATWQELLKRHPKNPAAAEALIALGRTNPSYWDQAIAQFPAHPRTVEIVQQRLQKNPKQPQLLLLLAKHALYLPNYTSILDQLAGEYAAQLTPQDWEAIAFGYWEKQAYGKAGSAYARAPYTPRNAYRIARGLQLGDRGGSVQAYQQMVTAFPNAEETPLSLMRLSKLSEPSAALSYLDQVIIQFPTRAPEALLEKAKQLDQLNSSKLALQVRQILLTQYGKSDAAAELRWTLAQQNAAASDLQTARKWAEPILSENSNSELAPQAGFWVGKWAQQAGQHAEAKTAFETVLSRYPQSYYAWRSASLLGWQVGDFNSVRQLNPEVAQPTRRSELPVGSATLKELHQLGQDRDTWTLWQTEFQNPMQPSVAEQFTDGVIRLGAGDFLDGMFMISFLSEREKPQEQSQYQELKKQTAYWRALYPFPYVRSIESWSQERQLNPLLVTALIRQESRFMPGIRSSVGATGLMQVMPDTASWIASKIKLKQYQLNDPDDNIKLGTWYLDYTHQEFNGNSLLAVASYNAGPGAVADWVTKKGLQDPDVFVEAIPFEETKGYVKSVFENYWNYLRLYNPEISQKVAQASNDRRSATGS